ncbi:nucleoside hydrolase [Peptacetobacter hiranonis]|uniref:Inosine-uridine preferring nucleoside hydrolase n=1 Tax=Peptacetobacter hiranonis (strain DSM 13275 / JCM 10541 / KCTC 15199 / TO-931) TaxID=500633 RepID=B6FXP6_PEPHT|nr:nucleoside hydrolase [Peptacetobacter hiranonis]EEA85695.1 Inosine-uridine preferring nucleoside hydrolase [Peptacetobacter hiranonis DSM 13275]QEK21851.1 Pyrimidine-specific ribonucleoside hydrolase RihB [Peptacetobacter hiranonis]
MKKVIYDCDNTMGLDNRDIDDGLALVYLVENKNMELLGVCTTYANDSLEYVHKQTLELVEDLGINLKVYKGRGKFEMNDYTGFGYKRFEDDGNFESNEAAKFIVEMANKYPNEIDLLATGSMQNLYDAYMIDNEIGEKLSSVVLMGGITGDLYFGDKIMKELNFSVCPKGAEVAIKKYKNVSILTGNRCMDVEFGTNELDKVKALGSNIKNEFIIQKIEKWMREFKEKYNYDSIVLWDVIAAIYLMNPDMFRDDFMSVVSTEEDLFEGRLVEGESAARINIPVVLDDKKVNDEMIKVVFER